MFIRDVAHLCVDVNGRLCADLKRMFMVVNQTKVSVLHVDFKLEINR